MSTTTTPSSGLRQDVVSNLDACKRQVEMVYCNGRVLPAMPIEWDRLLNCLHAYRGWEGLLQAQARNKSILQIVMMLTYDWGLLDNILIRTACKYGFEDLVGCLLLSRTVNPITHNQECLTIACTNGHIDVIRLLLRDRRVDPATTSALRIATTTCNETIVDLLLTHAGYTEQHLHDVIERVIPLLGKYKANNTQLLASSLANVYIKLITDRRMDTYRELAKLPVEHTEMIREKISRDPRIYPGRPTKQRQIK